MVKFTASKFEMGLIMQIAARAIARAELDGVDYPRRMLVMDLEATHSNGNPLDLNALLNAPNGDFGHDIYGIRQHMDRETGKLMNQFVPRASMPSSVLAVR